MRAQDRRSGSWAPKTRLRTKLKLKNVIKSSRSSNVIEDIFNPKVYVFERSPEDFLKSRKYIKFLSISTLLKLSCWCESSSGILCILGILSSTYLDILIIKFKQFEPLVAWIFYTARIRGRLYDIIKMRYRSNISTHFLDCILRRL